MVMPRAKWWGEVVAAFVGAILAFALLLLALIACAVVAHAEPSAAVPYRSTVIRAAHLVWGLDAPTPVMAAQLNQESAWRPRICSPFACGLAQFTPGTAKDMGRHYKDLAAVDVFNPQWAILALVRYDHQLYQSVPPARTACDRWAFTLSSYNGGLGWLHRDIRVCRRHGCDARVWFGQVERFNAGRSLANFRENRGYPRTILHNQGPYLRWGEEVKCSSH